MQLDAASTSRRSARRGRRLVVGLTLILAALVTAHAARPVERLRVGDSLPDFTLPRIEGGEFTADELDRKPVALLLWRTQEWLSRQVLRDVAATVRELGSDRVSVLAVAVGDSLEAVPRDATDPEANIVQLLDRELELYRRVGAVACPTLLVFDRHHQLHFIASGRPRALRESLAVRLRHLLGEIDEDAMQRSLTAAVATVDRELEAAARTVRLARRALAGGEIDLARASLETVAAANPTLAEAHCGLGFVALATGDLDTATAHFRTALEHGPGLSEAHLGRAIVLASARRHTEAETILIALLGQRSIYTRVRYELGRIHRARGEFERAAAYFEDALRARFPSSRDDAIPTTTIDPAALVIVAPSSQDESGRAETTPADSSANEDFANEKSADATPSTTTVGAEPTWPEVEAVSLPADAEYVGLRRCKKCHMSQWKSWKKTRMANAFQLLGGGQRRDEKIAVGLEPDHDYTRDVKCLSCHTTGFGYAGGYSIPAPGDALAARSASANEGIACESCHGPGSYAAAHQEVDDHQRPYTQQSFFDAGQFEVSARVCVRCHQRDAPCIGPEATFDYDVRKDQGTHQHFELKLRRESKR